MMARALQLVFKAFTSLIGRQHASGLDYIPKPPFIVAINHLGFFDVTAVYGQIGGPDITGWAAEKYERHLIWGNILRAGGAIFINRGMVDRKALDKAVAWLKSGMAFAIAPEGTRSPTRSLARAKTGIAYLADESGAPVVPCALTGTEQVLESLLRLRRAPITIRFGQAFHLPPIGDENRPAGLRRNTDEVMSRIAAMLPPDYRGIYADHPRTQQLLRAGYGEEPVEANAPARPEILPIG
jgi:1-acyl-sn-glycerol-3-phosphate acyltransferase